MSRALPDQSPIAAIATAPGRGGIGVVRISGRALAASGLLAAVLGEAASSLVQSFPRTARYGAFLEADGSEIDRGLALWFPAPHSYTGEDVLELQGHGGPVVLQMLLRRVLEGGADVGVRLAEPGEFTLRAWSNEKLDLVQAEAVADLIDASTEQAARLATQSLAGVFSQAVHGLVDALIALRTLVEATLDFPEEEIEFLQRADALGQLAGLRARVSQILAQARQGALLREGLSVVLVGEPNVGKSSLLNALAGAEVAIVTPIAGTTRDRVQQSIQIEGVPLSIIDTAGLRETEDTIERLGIARTWDEVARADVILHLVEAGAPDAAGEISARIAERLPRGVPMITVRNKIDRLGLTQGAVERDAQGTPHVVSLSAKQSLGIDLLRAVLLELAGWQGAGEGRFIARERHLRALRDAAARLDDAQGHALVGDERLDLFAEELRLAQEALNSITGEFSADDLLGEVFGKFCIGK